MIPNFWLVVYVFHCFKIFLSLLSTESTQLEDPRAQWQREQELMLRDYLNVVQEALSAQKEIYQVKEQRLHLAQQEYRQLNDAWRDKSTSQTSCKTWYSIPVSVTQRSFLFMSYLTLILETWDKTGYKHVCVLRN